MKIQQSFRYELNPTEEQRQIFASFAGAARWVFNWGLADRKRRFEENDGNRRFTSFYDQAEYFNWLKTQPIFQQRFPWLQSISQTALDRALRNVDRAFQNFSKGYKKGIGYPRFKKKGDRDSFTVRTPIKLQGKQIKLPTVGWIDSKEDTLKFKGRPLSATISREADRWYVSINVEYDKEDPQTIIGKAIGIDLGIKSFATLSNGETILSPRPLEKKLKKLRRLSKQHSNKKKGSNNRKKAALRLARLHRKIKNTRTDFVHKLSTRLATEYAEIGIEDLNISGMLTNGKLSRHISDQGWSELRRQLEYKTKWYGSKLVINNRFYASSKTCSNCGYLYKDLTLSIRNWTCPKCGSVHDRDINAAVNLQPKGTVIQAGTHTPVEIPLTAEQS